MIFIMFNLFLISTIFQCQAFSPDSEQDDPLVYEVESIEHDQRLKFSCCCAVGLVIIILLLCYIVKLKVPNTDDDYLDADSVSIDMKILDSECALSEHPEGGSEKSCCGAVNCDDVETSDDDASDEAVLSKFLKK